MLYTYLVLTVNKQNKRCLLIHSLLLTYVHKPLSVGNFVLQPCVGRDLKRHLKIAIYLSNRQISNVTPILRHLFTLSKFYQKQALPERSDRQCVFWQVRVDGWKYIHSHSLMLINPHCHRKHHWTLSDRQILYICYCLNWMNVPRINLIRWC